ncbi:hypothetical protein [Longimicrobium sp.]|uniref:hypothetical protein n=1 Tax=Longimicrobium sp. TaxID=2029185 RepID=UPI002C41C8FA|nr:hypothetical protein [Longimicrobium sp.]HSU14142.1 hypothetical protein [Longimicrobium sp.]
MVYPSDDRDLRARILAQRSRELRNRVATREAGPAEAIRGIQQLLDEAEELLRRKPDARGGE